jgi:hypothetical protein
MCPCFNYKKVGVGGDYFESIRVLGLGCEYQEPFPCLGGIAFRSPYGSFIRDMIELTSFESLYEIILAYHTIPPGNAGSHDSDSCVLQIKDLQSRLSFG